MENEGVRVRTPAAPDWACDRCNYDRHNCPGCGIEVEHGEVACNECGE